MAAHVTVGHNLCKVVRQPLGVSPYLRCAAANRCANSGESIDAACGFSSVSTAIRC